MKAITIWQPWATLIMVGAKPFEFRRWDYRTRDRSIEGQRVVIHAGARKVIPHEVQDLLLERRGRHGLRREHARQLLTGIGFKPGDGGVILPLAHALGTAVLGTPRKATEIFGGGHGDSGRIDQQIWAWPLSDIVHFEPPIPARGAQGFWHWHERSGA